LIIDFHTHIFPSIIRNNRRKYFFSEPGFKILYGSPNSKLAGVETLIHSMDEHRVDKSVVFGFPWKTTTTVKQHNDYIMNAVAKYNKRLIGLCCLDPLNKHSVSEAVRCIDGGLSGIGELAPYDMKLDQRFLDGMDPLMEICHEKDIPALIHTNEPIGHQYHGKTSMDIRDIYGMVKRFHRNKLVLAHWGGGLLFFNLLKREVKEILKNVYFDTAASPFLYDPSVYAVATRITGKDKILFGSDFPLLPPDRYFQELASTDLSKDKIERICGGNAANLLKLDV
jgi:predicted TIM-barrel fold metal-dependent hydrolase